MLESIYLALLMLAGCLVCLLARHRGSGAQKRFSGKKHPRLQPPVQKLQAFVRNRRGGFTIFQAATATGLPEPETEDLLNHMLRKGILERHENNTGVLIYHFNTPEKPASFPNQSKLFDGILDGA